MSAPYDLYNYPDFWKGREYENTAEKIALKKFFSIIKVSGSIIDIGGGYGRLSFLYCPRFKYCLLIDPSKKLLEIAKKDLEKFRNIKFKIGTAEKIPARDSVFDLALMVRVVHHVNQPLSAFREVYRVLKPHGYLILEFANKIHFLTRLKGLFGKKYQTFNNLKPVDIRSQESIKEEKIIFLNHHPQKIKKDLHQAGFQILDYLSVSNFRHLLIKKIIPPQLLIVLENFLQKPLSKIYFGPSIFLLCQKI